MTSESRHRRLESLFLECVELEASERAAFLDARCAGDPDLRAELEDLLKRDDTSAPSDVTLPLTIGAYILDAKLGEGGFGDVYAAEQTAPVRRRVAFKILKAGMDSRAVLARFETERQALALMDHPGIAKVFDAGVTESGRSYFVMELVSGEPITTYCETHRLSVAARLELFIAVCRAMEHAHVKGVIHRDLKPSNILVTTIDGVPRPKVIDFGIAKATTAPLAGEPARTLQGEVLGTPEYMSPEQAASRGSDVDTRSDVYSLGVVLYRLLVGRIPFTTERLRGTSVAEMQRILLEEEPVKPSEAVKSTPSNAAEARPLRGDLDWIVMRALEKDRERRYASAATFADDIERHLRNEPVLAGPPTTLYRLGKLVRRHRAFVAGGAAVAFALVLGLATTTLQAIRATRAEERARSEAEVATAVNEFLERMLSAGNPLVEARGLDVTMRDVALRAAAEVDADPPGSPAVEAGIRHALGATALGLGLYESAEAQLTRADAIRGGAASPLSRPALETRLKLAELQSLTGRDARAESTLAAIGDDIEREAASDPSFGALYSSMRGSILANLSRLAESDSCFTEALRVRREVAAKEGGSQRQDAELGSALQELAQVKRMEGRLEEAEAMAREALDVARHAHPGDHFDVASAEVRLASVLKDLGKYPEAEALNRESIARGERVLGVDHPLVAEWQSNLAQVLTLQGRLDESEAALRRGLEQLQRAKLEETRRGAVLLGDLADVLQQRGMLSEALALRLRTLDIQRRLNGDENEAVAAGWNNLGSTYRLLHRFGEAEAAFVAALAAFEKIDGHEHPNVFVALHNLGKTRLDDGRAALAEETLREAVLLGAKVFPDGHPTRAICAVTHGRALAALGRFDEARRELEEGRAALEAALGADHARTKDAAAELAKLEGK